MIHKKTVQEIKNRVSRNPLKTEVELRFSIRVSQFLLH